MTLLRKGGTNQNKFSYPKMIYALAVAIIAWHDSALMRVSKCASESRHFRNHRLFETKIARAYAHTSTINAGIYGHVRRLLYPKFVCT